MTNWRAEQDVYNEDRAMLLSRGWRNIQWYGRRADDPLVGTELSIASALHQINVGSYIATYPHK